MTSDKDEWDEIPFNVFDSTPIRRLRKNNLELDSAMRVFEENHGTEQTELVMLMSYGVRHAGPIDNRLTLVYQLAELLLKQADANRRINQAKVAAAVRHAENYAMKADVFDWLDANFKIGSRPMDDVALELAGSLVPAKYRAVRDWMTEWKKLRSAGTA